MRAIIRLAYEAACAFAPLIAVAVVEHRGGRDISKEIAKHQYTRTSRRSDTIPRGPEGTSPASYSRSETRVQQSSPRRRLAYGFGVCVFAVYILLVMWICGVGTFWDFVRGGAVGWRSQINLEPFSPYLNLVTWLLNVVLFMPLGFLLPCLWRGYDRLLPTFLFGFCFSLAIELSQLLNFRITDVDDLIANTLGAVLGLAAYLLLKHLLSGSRRREGTGHTKRSPQHRAPDAGAAGMGPTYEPVLYVAAMFLGVFFLYGARGHAEMRVVSWLDSL